MKTSTWVKAKRLIARPRARPGLVRRTRRTASPEVAQRRGERGDAALDRLGADGHERQAQGVGARRAGEERRAGHEGDAARDRLGSSASLSTPSGSSTQKNMPPPGICQRQASGPRCGRWAASAACIASRCDAGSGARIVGTCASRKPARTTSCTMRWLKPGVCRSAACLACSSLAKSAVGRDHVAEAQPGREHLREAAEVDRALGASARRSAPAARRRTRGRRTGCPRRSARRALARRARERGAPRARRSSGRSGSGSSAARRGSARRRRSSASAAGQRPVVVAGDADELGLVRDERLQRAEVGRRLDRDAAAGVDQHLADEVEALLRAGRDQHLRRVDRACPGAPSRPATHSRSGAKPSLAAYCSASRGVSRSTRAVASRIASTGKVSGRRQAAGERDDAGQLGELQDLADRRRVHPRGARRELPGRRREGRCHRVSRSMPAASIRGRRSSVGARRARRRAVARCAR